MTENAKSVDHISHACIYIEDYSFSNRPIRQSYYMGLVKLATRIHINIYLDPHAVLYRFHTLRIEYGIVRVQMLNLLKIKVTCAEGTRIHQADALPLTPRAKRLQKVCRIVWYKPPAYYFERTSFQPKSNRVNV